MSRKKKPEPKTGPFTIVRLGYGATLLRACELAKIAPSEVDLTQTMAEKPSVDLHKDFRIISFDGVQMTISERINGERSTRGFEVTAKGDTTEILAKPPPR